jgi:cytochrome c
VHDLLPRDLPLPLPVGSAGAFLVPVFHILLVVAFVVHILFINVLLGGSLASVWFNLVGVIRKSKDYDRAGYLMTTPVTISENMGALWGVAPLLIVSVMFTAFWYSAAVMMSPQILHIIYGNIVAFLFSYLYKFTWPHLHDRKGLHLSFGVASLLIFFSLPFVFMTTVQLYLTPGTWKLGLRFWEAMMRPDVFFRLGHFFLGSFAVSGVFMMIFGAKKRKNPDDAEAGTIVFNTGRSWFVVATGINLFVGLLTFFQFPSYGIEAFHSSIFAVVLGVGVLAAVAALAVMVRNVVLSEATDKYLKPTVALMAIAVLSMATGRHGMRLALLAPATAKIEASTADYQARVKAAKDAVAATAPVARSPGEATAVRYGCLACHAVDKRLVGPAYQDVAAKGYPRERIMELIRKPVPEGWPGYGAMPAMTSVTDDDAAVLADWINSLRR